MSKRIKARGRKSSSRRRVFYLGIPGRGSTRNQNHISWKLLNTRHQIELEVGSRTCTPNYVSMAR